MTILRTKNSGFVYHNNVNFFGRRKDQGTHWWTISRQDLADHIAGDLCVAGNGGCVPRVGFHFHVSSVCAMATTLPILTGINIPIIRIPITWELVLYGLIYPLRWLLWVDAPQSIDRNSGTAMMRIQWLWRGMDDYTPCIMFCWMAHSSFCLKPWWTVDQTSYLVLIQRAGHVWKRETNH